MAEDVAAFVAVRPQSVAAGGRDNDDGNCRCGRAAKGRHRSGAAMIAGARPYNSLPTSLSTLTMDIHNRSNGTVGIPQRQNCLERAAASVVAAATALAVLPRE